MLVLTLISKPLSGQRTEGQPMAESNDTLLTYPVQTGSMIVTHVQTLVKHLAMNETFSWNVSQC